MVPTPCGRRIEDRKVYQLGYQLATLEAQLARSLYVRAGAVTLALGIEQRGM